MYYLVYSLLYLVSLLPMKLLYVFSDGLYILLYYIIGYRKKIVDDNLALAFPEKTTAERRQIAKEFYRHFIDNFIETLKLFSASKAFIKNHFIVDNPEVYEQFYTNGRKCQLHLGHTFNWEFANVAMPFYTSYHFIVVYMPLTNKLFNRLLFHLRARTGTILLPATQMNKSIMPYRNKQYMLTLVADQAPSNPSGSYWLPFFGYPTPFVRAPERGARIADIPVVFGYLYKTKRGYYRAVLETGADNPARLPEGELTRRYIDFLERSIRRYPALYLWSHRRWKHEWKPEYGKMWVGNEGNKPLPIPE